MAFQIKFYKNSSDNRIVDKSQYLTLVSTLTGTLKEGTSIVNPDIIFEFDSVPNFNYVYIEAFKRYYFVKSIVNLSNSLWRLSLECDVLYTYKDAILNCVAFVDRSESSYNAMLVDNMLPVEAQPTYTYRTFTNSLFNGDYDFLISGYSVSSRLTSN